MLMCEMLRSEGNTALSHRCDECRVFLSPPPVLSFNRREEEETACCLNVDVMFALNVQSLNTEKYKSCCLWCFYLGGDGPFYFDGMISSVRCPSRSSSRGRCDLHFMVKPSEGQRSQFLASAQES